MRQTFKTEEAEQILAEAVRRSDEQELAALADPEVTNEKLQAMADELGVSPETLASVLEEREALSVAERKQTAVAQTRQEFIKQRRAEFLADFWSYMSTSGTLVAIWLLTSPHGQFWPMWPMLSWGFFVYWHASETLPTQGPEFEKAFADWQAKRERKAAKRAAKERRRSERSGGA